MQLNDNEVPKNACSCSLHFEETDLDRTALASVRVRRGAFPEKNVENDRGEKPAKRLKLSHDNSIEIENNSIEIEDNSIEDHDRKEISQTSDNIPSRIAARLAVLQFPTPIFSLIAAHRVK